MNIASMGPGTNTAPADPCKTPTPAGPIPIPYPNLAINSTSVPAVYNVLTGCTPTLNLLSTGVVSNGDQAGAVGGLLSFLIMGQLKFIVGCITIFCGGLPVQRVGSVTGQNAAGVLPNTAGANTSPSQFTTYGLG